MVYYKPANDREKNIMKVVMRKYSGKGARELVDVLEKHATDVRSLT